MTIGKKIHFIRSCTSTNDVARELAAQGAAEGTVIISEEQTEGRGTKSRGWFSARNKGLYVSVILRPQKSNIPLFPLLAGLAVSDAVFEVEGIRVRLKWPNDLVWKKRKMGGILSESSFLGNRLNYVILGIGLNISHEKADFPEEIRSSATSLRLITKKEVDRGVLLGKLWKTISRWYGLFLQGNEEKIVQTFQEYSIYPLGEKLRVEIDNEFVSGVFRGIDTRGGLILEVRGEKKIFFSAQVKAIKEIKED